MPQASNNSKAITFSSRSKQGGPHVRHHHHKYCFDRSDYVGYEQILAKNRIYKEPWGLEDNIRGELRYKPPPHNPDPYYRHHTWWREPGICPWEHEDLLYHSRPMRGAGVFNPWVLSTSANAPWATYDNEPLQEEVGFFAIHIIYNILVPMLRYMYTHNHTLK